MKRKIYLAVCLLLGAVFVFSAVQVGITLYRYEQADEVYEDLRDQFVMEVDPLPSAPASEHTSSPDPGERPTGQETVSNSDKEPTSEPATGPETEPEIGTDPADDTKPETQPVKKTEKTPPPEQAPIRVNFDGLLQANSDVIGWLYCKGTPINYPVVQSHDNEDYLHADLYGKYLYSGTLFADYRSGAVGTDQNLIIYGHTMKNDTMFGTLRDYKKQSYFNKHPYLFFLTPDQDYRIDLFAGFVTKSSSNLYYPNFQGADGFKSVLKTMKSKSNFKSDVTVTEDDHIVMLSSCDYEYDNARYVLFGKLTPINTPN